MSWEALGALGELIGALVVVLTLVYLSKQIRDNSIQLKANSINSVAALFNDAWQPIYNDESTRSIWVNGLRQSRELSEVEQATFDLFMHRLVNPFEVVVSHYEKGILDAESYQGYIARLHSMCISSPGGRDWYDRNRLLLADSLRLSIDQALEGGA